MDVKLAHNSFTVRLDSSHPDTKSAGDFFVAQPLSNRNKDFSFSGADLAGLRPICRSPHELIQRQPRNILAEVGFPGMYHFYGFNQFFGRSLFKYKSPGAGLKDADDIVRVVMHRKDQDL